MFRRNEDNTLYIHYISNHFRARNFVSRAAFRRFGNLRKSCRVFHDGLLLGRCFRSFVLAVLEYCSSVWCSTSDTHLKTTGPYSQCSHSFSTRGVFECTIAHRISVAVLCVLYKIRCNPMHLLYGALIVPYMPVRVACCALVAHRYIYETSRCRTSQHRRTFISLSVSLWNNLADPEFEGVRLARFKSRANAFCRPKLSCSFPFHLLLFSVSLLSSMGWYCGAGVFRLIRCQSLLPALHSNVF